MSSAVTGVAILFFIAVIAFFIFLYYFPIRLWIHTIAAGVPLGITPVRMRLSAFRRADRYKLCARSKSGPHDHDRSAAVAHLRR